MAWRLRKHILSKHLYLYQTTRSHIQEYVGLSGWGWIPVQGLCPQKRNFGIKLGPRLQMCGSKPDIFFCSITSYRSQGQAGPCHRDKRVPVTGTSGAQSPRHGASSGRGWRNGLQIWRVAAIYWINSRGQPTRGGLPTWRLGEILTTLHCKKLIILRHIQRDKFMGVSSAEYNSPVQWF